MQFSTLFLTALASAQAAFAASGSKEFGPLAIHSGSDLQYTSIAAEGDDLYFGYGSEALTANVTDCGFLQFKDGSYAYVESQGFFKKAPRRDAMPGFSIKDGALLYNNNDLFGVKDGDHYRVSSKSNPNGSLGVRVRATDMEEGSGVIPDYTPENKDCHLGP